MAQLTNVSAEVVCFRCRVSIHPRCRCKPKPVGPQRYLMSALVLGLCLGCSALVGTLVGAAFALIH